MRVEIELSAKERQSLDGIVAAIEHHRGRPIKISEKDWLVGTGATGLWLPFPDVDDVLIMPTPSTLYRTQIILHELAHMILGHDKIADAIATLTGPFIGENAARQHALARSSGRNEYELAAEKLADELAADIRPQSSEPGWFAEVMG